MKLINAEGEFVPFVGAAVGARLLEPSARANMGKRDVSVRKSEGDKRVRAPDDIVGV